MTHRSFSPKCALLVLVSLTACSKDKDDAASPSGGGGGTPDPFAGYELSLTTAFQRTETTNTHYANAILLDPSHTRSPIDSVALSGIELQPGMFMTNMYNLPAGSAFNVLNDDAHWHVNINDTVPTIERTITAAPFPSVGNLTSSTVISSSMPYTLSVSSMENADSVIFAIGHVVRTMPGNSTSCSFTVGEMSALTGASGADIMISASRTQIQTIGGLRVRFVKSYTHTRSVLITN